MADLLESESVQALLAMKHSVLACDGGAAKFGATKPAPPATTTNCSSRGGAGGGVVMVDPHVASFSSRVKVEPEPYPTESGAGLLSALGLNPAGSRCYPGRTCSGVGGGGGSRSANSTPIKDSPPIRLNRRGTPQRVRKRNRLYYDDNHVMDDICRSPKKSSSSAAGRCRVAPAACAVKSCTSSPCDQLHIKQEQALQDADTPPFSPAQRASRGSRDVKPLSAAVSECGLDGLAEAMSVKRDGGSSPLSGLNELSFERQRQAHQLGLRMRNLLKLPKAHKWVCYEWFYSTLDQCLLCGSNDFLVCVREQYPRLKTTCLARKEWSKLRRQMGKPRRCSSAFFLEERSVLNSQRHKVRSLQTLQRKSYDRAFVKNLPEEIPLQLSIGTRVTARLRHPQDGLFNGVVQAVDTVNASYRISFDRAGVGCQSVADYNVRSLETADTVPTVSFVRGAQSQRSLVFSTPPRPTGAASVSSAAAAVVTAGDTVTARAAGLGSPLCNDPLLSALTPSKCELSQLLDEQGVINGYSVKFLLNIVHLNKLLIVKRDLVSQLDSFNSRAEHSQLFAEPLAEQFRRDYATLVLRLDTLNEQLQQRATSVQLFCHKMLPDVGLVPDVLPTHMKRLCDEEASRQVAAASSARHQLQQRRPRHIATLQLITRLASLLLQMKNFADNEMNPFELSSLEETMREIGATLVRPASNAGVFQDHVQVNVAHVQQLLTARWNWRQQQQQQQQQAATRRKL